MGIEVSKDTHEVVDAIVLRLSPDKAKELAGLLFAVPVSGSDTFDDIAFAINNHFSEIIPRFEADADGEYSLATDEEESGGCGCSSFFGDGDHDIEEEFI